MSYPKIENLYARDDETHRLVLGELRRPDFGQVGSWLMTEKIDGTNIRLTLDAGGSVTVNGRTNAATLPKNFVEEALPDLTAERMLAALADIDEAGKARAMVVYGEGYGPGIQKGGGDYATRKSLRIFDVVTYLVSDDGDVSRGLWRTFDDVETVASVLGLKTAPVVGVGRTTDQVVSLVQGDPLSVVAMIENPSDDPSKRMEGVIARTDPYLFDYRGNRVVFKLKAEDLP